MRLDPAQRRAILASPAGWIACGFGSGLSPLAPGTAGSAAALLPWFVLRELPLPLFAAVLVLAFAIGVWVSDIVIAKLGIADPGVVVWDEFLGQWIALAPLIVWPSGWPWIIVGFVLFRLFDISKPWPASWADRSLSGGVGVMLDDVIAGLYAAIALSLALAVAAHT